MENLIKRVQKIINYYELSASKFADSIHVQRSSISHLLSGRNKPSLDFVLKIINTYDEVSIDWLLLGKGSFPNTSSTTLENPTPTPPQDLFSNAVNEKLAVEIPKQVQITSEVVNKSTDNKAIEQIIIFYTDGSFKNYS